jgi:hypothetical protein
VDKIRLIENGGSMRHIAESGFGFRCNLIALFGTFTLMAATTAHAANTAPTISGTPKTSITAGSYYWFKPSAYDANGNKLTFRISNKPVWANFRSDTGALGGTPTAANVGKYYNIVISVSDGMASRSLPAFTITVLSSTNIAPKISGTPITSVSVGTAYSFQPSASDANNNPLTFSILNKPSWASFSTTTGRLSGTPSSANVGTTSNITIRVSDGKLTTSLPAFSLAVTQIGSGSATVSWLPPTTNTNGTSLSNLAGYRVRYGTSASSLTKTVQLANPGLSRYMITNLSPGTWYFGVQAYTSTGTESALSKLASKTIR